MGSYVFLAIVMFCWLCFFMYSNLSISQSSNLEPIWSCGWSRTWSIWVVRALCRSESGIFFRFVQDIQMCFGVHHHNDLIRLLLLYLWDASWAAFYIRERKRYICAAKRCWKRCVFRIAISCACRGRLLRPLCSDENGRALLLAYATLFGRKRYLCCKNRHLQKSAYYYRGLSLATRNAFNAFSASNAFSRYGPRPGFYVCGVGGWWGRGVLCITVCIFGCPEEISISTTFLRRTIFGFWSAHPFRWSTQRCRRRQR